MAIYKAKKGNAGFYIQPDMIEDYSNLGYEIVKMEEVPVENIELEIAEIEKNRNGVQIYGE